MTGLAEYLPVEAYVPHRDTMLLLHRVLRLDDDGAVAEVVVPADGPFARETGVPAWVGIEYMAQTVAAYAGGVAQRGRAPVRLGFLLGSRRYEAFVPEFPAGALLRVEADCELMSESGLGMFDCRIFLADELVASAKLSVYQPENAAELLEP